MSKPRAFFELPAEQLKRLEAAYRAGSPMADLVSRFGVSRPYLRKLLRKLNVPARQNGADVGIDAP